MKMRQTLILVAVFLLGVLAAGAFFSRPAAADTPSLAAPQAAVGRYQITHTTGGEVVVIDTMTGQCWENSTVASGPDHWHDAGSPVKAK